VVSSPGPVQQQQLPRWPTTPGAPAPLCFAPTNQPPPPVQPLRLSVNICSPATPKVVNQQRYYLRWRTGISHTGNGGQTACARHVARFRPLLGTTSQTRNHHSNPSDHGREVGDPRWSWAPPLNWQAWEGTIMAAAATAQDAPTALRNPVARCIHSTTMAWHPDQHPRT